VKPNPKCIFCGYDIPKGRRLCIGCAAMDISNSNFKKGEEGFEVEWCYDLPLVPGTSDAEVDKAAFRSKVVRTEKDARMLANWTLKLDKFGAVRVTPVRLVDPHEGTEYAGLKLEWEHTGDGFEVSE